MITVFIMMACAVPETDNPLAVDNDGDGYTEFQGDLNDNDPDVYNGSDYIHKDDCPEAVVSLDPTVLEVVCPELPDINLSCPEVICPEQPTINLECPEPVINVAAPSVIVEPVEVSISNDFSDLVLAIEDLSANTGYPSDFFVSGGMLDSSMGQVIVFENVTSYEAILTRINLTNVIDCHLEDASGNFVLNVGHGTFANASQEAYGDLNVPIESGGKVQCYTSEPGAANYFLGGYYQ